MFDSHFSMWPGLQDNQQIRQIFGCPFKALSWWNSDMVFSKYTPYYIYINIYIYTCQVDLRWTLAVMSLVEPWSVQHIFSPDEQESREIFHIFATIPTRKKVEAILRWKKIAQSEALRRCAWRIQEACAAMIVQDFGTEVGPDFAGGFSAWTLNSLLAAATASVSQE